MRRLDAVPACQLSRRANAAAAGAIRLSAARAVWTDRLQCAHRYLNSSVGIVSCMFSRAGYLYMTQIRQHWLSQPRRFRLQVDIKKNIVAELFTATFSHVSASYKSYSLFDKLHAAVTIVSKFACDSYHSVSPCQHITIIFLQAVCRVAAVY